MDDNHAEFLSSYFESTDRDVGVTYTWLARELCISGPTARDVLAAFAASHPGLVVHYLVCGNKASEAGVEEDGGTISPHMVSIVPASQLEGA